MNLLVVILVYFLVFGLVYFLIQKAPFGEDIKQIALYVLLVVFVIAVIGLLTGVGPFAALR